MSDVLYDTPAWWQDGSRNEVPSSVDMIASELPRLFILETVRGLSAPRHRNDFDNLLRELRLLGYFVEWKVLRAGNVEGKRLFIVGIRLDEGGQLEWPRRQDGEPVEAIINRNKPGGASL